MPKIEKADIVETLNMSDKLYGVFAKNDPGNIVFIRTLPVLAKLCITLYPIFSESPFFLSLFEYADKLLSQNIEAESHSAQIPDAEGTFVIERKRLLQLLENFELSLMKNARFNIVLKNCTEANIRLNPEYVNIVNSLPEIVREQDGAQDITVLVYAGARDNSLKADISLQAEEAALVFNEMVKELEHPDYYRYDRLYLEAKLESLRRRQDIRLLLAGSSYTMCGLFENQMPIPSRNVAVDAQDLYYTVKTVYKALEYNPNITDCIVSLPYYFWGYDISRSTSVKMQKRVMNVDYPIFEDRHHFSGPIDERSVVCPATVTPLMKHIFSFEKTAEDISGDIKKVLEDEHYFRYPREGSLICSSDDATNRKYAQLRTASHNKFFKYTATVEENRQLFESFLEEVKRRGVRMLFFVPPAARYYREYLDKGLKSEFYSYLNPFKEKYDFRIVDLLDSDIFKDEDFFDYDHVNDQGAKKLGERLIKELAAT